MGLLRLISQDRNTIHKDKGTSLQPQGTCNKSCINCYAGVSGRAGSTERAVDSELSRPDARKHGEDSQSRPNCRESSTWEQPGTPRPPTGLSNPTKILSTLHVGACGHIANTERVVASQQKLHAVASKPLVH